MLQRVVRQFFHQYGNGRAVDNARRAMARERFVHERIDALARRLPENPAAARGGRGAA
jgi:hypothetical protein